MPVSIEGVGFSTEKEYFCVWLAEQEKFDAEQLLIVLEDSNYTEYDARSTVATVSSMYRLTCKTPPWGESLPASKTKLLVFNDEGEIRFVGKSTARDFYFIRDILAVSPVKGSSSGGTQLVVSGAGFPPPFSRDLNAENSDLNATDGDLNRDEWQQHFG